MDLDEGLRARVDPCSDDPNVAWDRMKERQVVRAVTLVSPGSRKPEGHTRFVCISDTHKHASTLPRIPDGDVLLHTGDFTKFGNPEDIENFRHLLAGASHLHKVLIAGNHDLVFDVQNYDTLHKKFGRGQKNDPHALKDMIVSLPRVTYLEDSGTVINGIKIWGTPWVPVFCNSAFNIPRGAPCLAKWDLIPEGTDVLMTHGPPVGHGDLCKSGIRAGCVDLLATVQDRVKPKYHVFGHIHEGYGATTDGHTIFVNCAICNLRYKPVNKPIIFDLPNCLPCSV
ncbi:hypothetical protein EMCRGX_G025324 [Ephydatia muelleri]|eukprot:Em0021g173a